MGKAKIKRILSSESKWVDKDAPRHKHNYSNHAVVQLRNVDNISYYDVMKCSECSSFKTIPKPGSISGLIGGTYSGDLEIIRLYSSHKWRLGFADAVLDTDNSVKEC